MSIANGNYYCFRANEVPLHINFIASLALGVGLMGGAFSGGKIVSVLNQLVFGLLAELVPMFVIKGAL